MNNYPYYTKEDYDLISMIGQKTLLENVDPDNLKTDDRIKTFEVYHPDSDFEFLHESAIISFKGRLFASWYNCPKMELISRAAIRFRTSDDNGKTWSQIKTVADDPSGKILYCPPVFYIQNEKLYMLLNEMVGPDLIHSLDLYVYSEIDERFDFVFSRPIPHKVNTNVIKLNNGKLMIPGRIAEMDHFPNTPSVLFSDDGDILGNYRLVKIQKNGDLPDGSSLIHPEISPIVSNNIICMFCRNDKRHVPLLYYSSDYGENWSAPTSFDIPFSNAKIYSGTLSNGINYVIGNLHNRKTLAIFFSAPGKMTFRKGFIVKAGPDPKYGCDENSEWTYPSAYEADGNLYIIYTMVIKDSAEIRRRGALLSVIPLDTLNDLLNY